MTNQHLQPVLEDILAHLQTLARDRVQPAEAQASLRRLEARYPETSLDLVWVEEAYDQSVHYDALLHLPGEGTVSLSFSPERTLPWPLRGVQRWQDRDIARVNDTVLTVDHAMACLDFIWDQVPIVRRLVNVCLIEEALQREPISLSDDELQRALDDFRRARRLFTAEETHRWMADKGVAPEKLERLVSDQATVAKLRDRIAAGRVDEYFAAHRDDFATVALLRLEFPDEERARQAFDEVQQGADFGELARRAVAEAVARGEKVPTFQSMLLRKDEAASLEPLHGSVAREVPADLVSSLFAAQPGDVFGPVRADQGAALLQAVALAPAQLDIPTREAIVRLLFEEWLRERRRMARIEWFWGNAAQVSAA